MVPFWYALMLLPEVLIFLLSKMYFTISALSMLKFTFIVVVEPLVLDVRVKS